MNKYIITVINVNLQSLTHCIQATANFYCNNKQTALLMANVYFSNEFKCNANDLQILNIKAVY